MKILTSKFTLVILSGLFLASSAWAGFDITRMTTVVDDQSGSYTVTKSGRLEAGQFTGTSLTEFNDFHPGDGDQEASLTGVVSKQTSRGNGQISTTADGAFVLASISGSMDVSFTGLNIMADDQGVELKGAVTVNDTTYDAAELPDGVAAVLRRVFWLTRR
ncbi:hypothetical protein [Marinicella meishanensis]|uniref:hypothetical protein n=1 Tax=Marinicella meishanensis TaxID=2873263 RepID=UPI001CBCDEFE|nr:hypothetical protein [Marinicella sp. NBU2979]